MEALIAALEAGVLGLVRSAPHGSPAQVAEVAERAFELALGAAAEREGARRTELVGLACAMEACLELIVLGLVDPGVALPALAMAADAAKFPAAPVLAAARYEIETLLPVPGAAAAPRRSLDVQASSLVRRLPVAAAAAAAAGPVSDSSSPAVSGPASAPAHARRQELASRWPQEAGELVARARQRLRPGG